MNDYSTHTQVEQKIRKSAWKNVEASHDLYQTSTKPSKPSKRRDMHPNREVN